MIDTDIVYTTEKKYSFYVQDRSEWICYMFGGDKGEGLSYRPSKGKEPNWFVRWMMSICFACKWVKEPM